MEKVSLSGNTIYLRLLAMKGFDAIRPEYSCFISMIISVDTLCGFAPLQMLVLKVLCCCFPRCRVCGGRECGLAQLVLHRDPGLGPLLPLLLLQGRPALGIVWQLVEHRGLSVGVPTTLCRRYEGQHVVLCRRHSTRQPDHLTDV